MITDEHPSPPATVKTRVRLSQRIRQMTRTVAVATLCTGACAAESDGPDPRDDRQEEPDGKAKVYILLGQSNMVGFGQIDGNGSPVDSQFYVSAAPDAAAGMALSVYSGPYDPSADYDALTPMQQVVLDVEAAEGWPSVTEPHTSVLRGFVQVPATSDYVFEWGKDASSFASVVVDGHEVYRKDPGQPAARTERVSLTEGQRHSLGITYFEDHGPGASIRPVGLPGALETVVKDEGRFPELLADDGSWRVRDDVWYRGVIAAVHDELLTVGLGSDDGHIGPELMFGNIMGDFHGDKVIVLKASHDGGSLGTDLLPPGSERFTVDGVTYAGYEDPDDQWPENEQPEPVEGWYAGKQYDDVVTEIRTQLNDCEQSFGTFASGGCEIAGFAYFQGHGDTGNDVHAARYEHNLATFIRAIRAEFDAGDAPFVVATIGFQPMAGNTLAVAAGQLAVSEDRVAHPEFVDNVRTVDVRRDWRDASNSPGNDGHHYNQNAETYLRVGEALGEAMVTLRSGGPGPRCNVDVPPVARTGRTLRVFVLSGQSNMQGHGEMYATDEQLERNGGMGTLEYVADNAPEFSFVADSQGQWTTRDDVWIVDLDRTGPLTAGFGAQEHLVGPELAFGHEVGEFFDDPVLIIKASWGGKSLGADFRPPSAGGDTGPFYTQLTERVHHVLDNLATELPEYGGGPYQLMGVAWHQGWNDRVNETHAAEYESNAVHFINDLRAEFGIPDLPFVLANTGMTGWDESHERALMLMETQLAVADNPGLLEPASVGAVETRDFWRPAAESPSEQGYHWSRNAHTYLLIGRALARDLLTRVECR